MATKFQQRHYETMAEKLRVDIRRDLDATSYARVVANIMDMFQNDSTKFRAEKFRLACYPKATPVT